MNKILIILSLLIIVTGCSKVIPTHTTQLDTKDGDTIYSVCIDNKLHIFSDNQFLEIYDENYNVIMCEVESEIPKI